MIRLYLGRDKSPLQPSQLLHISQPKPLVWLSVFAFLAFFFAALLVEMNNLPLRGAFWGIVAFFGFAIYVLGNDVVIGQSHLLERRRFPFRRETYYLLAEIVEIRLTWYQFIETRFQDGRVVRFSSSDFRHMELPAFTGQISNPMLEGLLRVKQELERRSQDARQNPERFDPMEKAEMERQASPAGWGSIATAGTLGFIMLFSGGAWLHERGLQSLKAAENPQSLRASHFEDAFFLYRGSEFEKMKSESVRICEENADHHCRFAYYLLDMEG
ncbi:MAG TPA: hypothetical protein PL182_06665, partial [Pseudobdellovibrionaceae bacterium]|nr:hypothetical protein [Pseudobdellovibrionaceae bacterium]